MRVPVGVEDDDGVGGLQVEAEPARPRGEEEDEVLRVLVVEGLEHVGAVVGLGHPVQAEEAVPLDKRERKDS